MNQQQQGMCSDIISNNNIHFRWKNSSLFLNSDACIKTAIERQMILVFQIQLKFKYLWYQNSVGGNFQHE